MHGVCSSGGLMVRWGRAQWVILSVCGRGCCYGHAGACHGAPGQCTGDYPGVSLGRCARPGLSGDTAGSCCLFSPAPVLADQALECMFPKAWRGGAMAYATLPGFSGLG